MNRRTVAILFLDVSGYSKLTEPQLNVYMQNILPELAKIIQPYSNNLSEINTWGDAIIAVSSDPYNIARLSLELRDFFKNRNWLNDHLPSDLSSRIALHAGAVTFGFDPIRNIKGIIGAQVNLAARIEPVTIPGEVWCTDQFMGLVDTGSDPKLAFDDLGECPLAKKFGSVRLWRLRRAYEKTEKIPEFVPEIPGVTSEAGQIGQLTILESKKEIFDTIIKTKSILEKKRKGTNKEKIRLMSCHGPNHKDYGLGSLLAPIFKELLMSGDWIFQEVTGIYSSERLKQKMAQYESVGKVKHSSLKAFITVNSPTVICPLIIGENDVLLGTDDEDENTAGQAIYLQGEKYVKLFTSYFDSHFTKRNIYTLLDDHGINSDEVERLKNILLRILEIK